MKLFRGWRVVAGSAVGNGFSSQTFIATGYTILASGLSTAFGWQLNDVAPGATFFLAGQIVGYPIAGMLVDRWGTLRVALAGLVLFGLHLLLLSRIDTQWQLYALMLSMGICGPTTYAVTYIRAISLWFSRRRGLALGLAASGVALGAVMIPIGMQRIIAASNWSVALVAMAAFELFIVLPVVSLLVRDEPTRYGLRPDGDAVPSQLSTGDDTAPGPSCGMTFANAVRTLDFWMLGTVFMVVGMAVYAVLTNTVHILSNTASLGAAQVAKVQAIGGVTVLIGSNLGGIMLDRLRNDRWIGVAMNMHIALGIVAYAMSDNIGLAIVGAVLIGFSLGGEGNVLPYMTAKYFGTQEFGKIYGALGAMFGIGTALGPVTYARLVTLTGSVSATLLFIAACTALASSCFLVLGRSST